MPDPSAPPGSRIPIEPTVTFEGRVISGISLEVLNAFHRPLPHGNEAGGILLGRPGEPILVDDFEPVLCEHRSGPSYVLSDGDLEGLEESVQWFRTSQADGLQILGFYRSQARLDFSIEERDNELMRRFFAGPGSLFLLLKPGRGETITAELFVWSEGKLRPTGHPMVFPSDTGILAYVASAGADDEDKSGTSGADPSRKDPQTANPGLPDPAANLGSEPQEEVAAVVIPRVSLPPAHRRQIETQEIPSRNWTWVAALLALTAAAAVLGYRSVGPRNSEKTPVSISLAPSAQTNPASTPMPASPPGTATRIAAATASQPAVSPETEQGIRDALAQWERAVRSGDPNQIAACYASQLDRYFQQRNSSNDEVRRAALQSVARYGKPAILRISDVTLTPVSEDRAVASFRKHWQTSGPRVFAGEEQERLTFVKAEDSWKIASEEETKVYWTQKPRG